MLIIPSGVKINLVLGHTDMRKGLRQPRRPGAGSAQEGSVLGSSVRLPWQEGRHDWDGNELCLFTNYLASYCISFNLKRGL